jgi:hypothetical protein
MSCTIFLNVEQVQMSKLWTFQSHRMIEMEKPRIALVAHTERTELPKEDSTTPAAAKRTAGVSSSTASFHHGRWGRGPAGRVRVLRTTPASWRPGLIRLAVRHPSPLGYFYPGGSRTNRDDHTSFDRAAPTSSAVGNVVLRCPPPGQVPVPAAAPPTGDGARPISGEGGK